MTEATFLELIGRNPVNAAILQRLPELGAPQAQLVAGCLFGAVWNAHSGRPLDENVNDYDLFYYDPDDSYEAEDEVIRRADALYADLGAKIEVRNQARVHLWFESKFGQTRPPIASVRQGVEQFLVRCTCLGVDEHGAVYAPCGLDELEAGLLRPNPLNADQNSQNGGQLNGGRLNGGRLYAAKVQSYKQRWPWLREG